MERISQTGTMNQPLVAGDTEAIVLQRKRIDSGEPAGVADVSPFIFTDYFHGHTKASGWFSDRFGRPRRHFHGDFFGSFDDSRFCLDETLYYTDGLQEKRQWLISIDSGGIFTAQSASLINAAKGVLSGNQLCMEYTMRVMVAQEKYWNLHMKDLMILQPDGSLHNITQVYKWGIRLGTVSTQYQQCDA